MYWRVFAREQLEIQEHLVTLEEMERMVKMVMLDLRVLLEYLEQQ